MKATIRYTAEEYNEQTETVEYPSMFDILGYIGLLKYGGATNIRVDLEEGDTI